MLVYNLNRVAINVQHIFCLAGHAAPGQGYTSSGLPMVLSSSGNQPQYNPHSSHSSGHQSGLPSTNPQYHSNQGMIHSNQVVMTHTNPRPQSARCLLQTKGQKSTDGFHEQVSVHLSLLLSVLLSIWTTLCTASPTTLEVCMYENRLIKQ